MGCTPPPPGRTPKQSLPPGERRSITCLPLICALGLRVAASRPIPDGGGKGGKTRGNRVEEHTKSGPAKNGNDPRSAPKARPRRVSIPYSRSLPAQTRLPKTHPPRPPWNPLGPRSLLRGWRRRSTPGGCTRPSESCRDRRENRKPDGSATDTAAVSLPWHELGVTPRPIASDRPMSRASQLSRSSPSRDVIPAPRSLTSDSAGDSRPRRGAFTPHHGQTRRYRTSQRMKRRRLPPDRTSKTSHINIKNSQQSPRARCSTQN